MDPIVVLTVLAALCVLYIIYVYFDMVRVIDRQRQRISEMATMLQIAEYQTDRSYYTSLVADQMSYEYPNWLYKAKRDKLIESALPTESTVTT